MPGFINIPTQISIGICYPCKPEILNLNNKKTEWTYIYLYTMLLFSIKNPEIIKYKKNHTKTI